MKISTDPHFQDHLNHVQQLINAVLEAADPATAVNRHLHRNGRFLTVGSEKYTLGQGKIYLISVGKAAVPMGLATAKILEGLVTTAIFITKKSTRDWGMEIEASGLGFSLSTLQLFLAGHPVPDEESVRAGTAALNLLTQTTQDDLVIFLISGGASALMAQPKILLPEWQQLTQILLASGCTIIELNCVRRQLDKVKGGGLARAANPAACISLILSDVVGNPLEAIGSGPTVITDESPADALAVLTCYGIEKKMETAVWERITAVLQIISDTSGDQPIRNQHHIIGDVRQAAAAALTKAAQLGFIAQTLTTHLEGEAREIGKLAAAIAKDAPASRCLILGGETTVTLHGSGKGGRNQELALSAAISLEGWANRVIVSFATDGEDGPTDAAGGIVTGETTSRAKACNLSPSIHLQNNDSYTFFHLLDREIFREEDHTYQHHIRTGSTGTNVNDLIFIITYAPSLNEANHRYFRFLH